MFCPELSDTLRSSISSTTIKYCSRVLGKERSYMLNDLLPCTEEFLDQQVQDKKEQFVKFACVVKGEAPSSISIKYPNITPIMQMTPDEYATVLASNRMRLHPPKASRYVETIKEPWLSDAPAPPEEFNEHHGYPPQPTVATVEPPPSPPPTKKDDSDSAAEW